jgi:hypothetical protein
LLRATILDYPDYYYDEREGFIKDLFVYLGITFLVFSVPDANQPTICD